MARIWNKHKQTNTPLKRKVFVALSGGVDSSVAAALLQKQGFHVIGIHIKMWSDPSIPCTTKEDRYDAMRVSAHLGIPFETWDFTEEYKRGVVDYMIHEYAGGGTPNPDVMCNREIKFGAFLKRALSAGADYIATGHYVRLGISGQGLGFSGGGEKINAIRYTPYAARDGAKDQSYFLWTLTKAQLKHCLFPIGDYMKSEVRELARKFGLPTAEKKDSQGLCFMGDINLSAFLKNYIQEHTGVVRTLAGKAIGEHRGVEFFTIGQRNGIGIGGGTPYYVVQKDRTTNVLTVAESQKDTALYRQELAVGEISWVQGNAPDLPLQCSARIRYRQPLQSCRIERIPANEENMHVRFDQEQRAVAPGQSVVFYRGEGVLGGGVIQ